MSTKIEWVKNRDGSAGETWNPVRGCSLTSLGCKNCYAMKFAHRFSGKGGRYEGLTELGPNGPRWNGTVRLVPDHLDKPLRWRKPRAVFVNSMSDLFHEDVPDEYIAAVFGVMAATPQHTYQILTKRAERMVEWFEWAAGTFTRQQRGIVSAPNTPWAMLDAAAEYLGAENPNLKAAWTWFEHCGWPLKNCWIGVSVENQETADERIPLLLQVPAAVRWVSAEPLLSQVRLDAIGDDEMGAWYDALRGGMRGSEPNDLGEPRLSWVVVGGESGPGARLMHPEWAQSLRDQCVAAGVPFFFKQWGEWLPLTQGWEAGVVGHTGPDQKPTHVRCGKKKAGRELDGRTWSEMPGEKT